MNKQVRGHLLNFFRELIQSQKSLQCIRKELNSLKNYHPLGIFERIAKENEFITIRMMTEFLKGKIVCSERDLYEVFQKFDHKRRGVIDKKDFCRELSSSEKKIAKKINEKISCTYEIQQKFLYYLNTTIKSCRVLDVWRKKLSIIEPYKLFSQLDYSLDGKIGPPELSKFFLKNKQSLNVYEADFLYRILLRRHYNQVNLEVFCENLNPREFGGYQRYTEKLKRDAQREQEQKVQKEKQAIEVQKNYYKQLNNQKVVEFVHQEAALLRQKELQNKIKDQLQVYQQLKFIAKKKYNPSLTFQQFIRSQKQNIDKLNLKRRRLIDEAMRKELEYKSCLLHIDVARQIQALERSKIEKLPVMIIQNRILSNFNTHQKEKLEERIKRHKVNRLNSEHRTPLTQTTRQYLINNSESFIHKGKTSIG